MNAQDRAEKARERRKALLHAGGVALCQGLAAAVSGTGTFTALGSQVWAGYAGLGVGIAAFLLVRLVAARGDSLPPTAAAAGVCALLPFALLLVLVAQVAPVTPELVPRLLVAWAKATVAALPRQLLPLVAAHALLAVHARRRELDAPASMYVR
jgi:hypothetical protein